jgi:hypothetical protein
MTEEREDERKDDMAGGRGHGRGKGGDLLLEQRLHRRRREVHRPQPGGRRRLRVGAGAEQDHADLGFRRIVVSETEAPNIFVDLD